MVKTIAPHFILINKMFQSNEFEKEIPQSQLSIMFQEMLNKTGKGNLMQI